MINILTKEPVLCFVITKNLDFKGEGVCLWIQPISMNTTDGSGYWDGNVLESNKPDEQIIIEKDDEILGVIPAQPNTFKMYANLKKKWEFIGYEFPGASNPDFELIAKEKLKKEKELI